MNPEAQFYFPISFKVIRHLTWTNLLCSLLVDGSPLSTAAFPKFVIAYSFISYFVQPEVHHFFDSGKKPAAFCCICPEIPKLCWNPVTYLLPSHSQLVSSVGSLQQQLAACCPSMYGFQMEPRGQCCSPRCPPYLGEDLPEFCSLLKGSSLLMLLTFSQWTYLKLQRIWVFLVFPFSAFFSDISLRLVKSHVHTFSCL